MKIIKYIILLALLVAPLAVISSVAAMEPVNDSTYIFHLNYGKGVLTVDKDTYLPYDLIPEAFVDKPGLYYGRVFSVQNEPLGEFHYDLLEGKNNVAAPYFTNAKSVAFYQSNSDKTPLLTASVSDSAVCNEDKVCQQDAGETQDNCQSDCHVANGEGNVNNANIAPTNNSLTNSTAANPAVQKYFNILVIGFVILGVATIVVFVIMFIRRNRNQ
jgi:hypothetical protein